MNRISKPVSGKCIVRRPIGGAFTGEKLVKDCTVFAPATEEEVWQYIRLRYARGTRHLIVDAPGYPELVGREIVIAACPRRGSKTVLISLDGKERRWPIGWLRPIVSER